MVIVCFFVVTMLFGTKSNENAYFPFLMVPHLSGTFNFGMSSRGFARSLPVPDIYLFSLLFGEYWILVGWAWTYCWCRIDQHNHVAGWRMGRHPKAVRDQDDVQHEAVAAVFGSSTFICVAHSTNKATQIIKKQNKCIVNVKKIEK